MVQDYADRTDYMKTTSHVFAAALHRAYGFDFLLFVDNAKRYGDCINGVERVVAVDDEGCAYGPEGRRPAHSLVGEWLSGGRGQRVVQRLFKEDDLAKYVGELRSRPLCRYAEGDVDIALQAAEELLEDVLPPLAPSMGM